MIAAEDGKRRLVALVGLDKGNTDSGHGRPYMSAAEPSTLQIINRPVYGIPQGFGIFTRYRLFAHRSFLVMYDALAP